MDKVPAVTVALLGRITVPVLVSPSLGLSEGEHCHCLQDSVRVVPFWISLLSGVITLLCPVGRQVLHLPFLHTHPCRIWGDGATRRGAAGKEE